MATRVEGPARVVFPFAVAAAASFPEMLPGRLSRDEYLPRATSRQCSHFVFIAKPSAKTTTGTP